MKKLGDLGVLAVGVLAVSWGGPLVRFTTSPALTVAAWRLIFSSLVLLPLGIRKWRGKDAKYAGLAGLFLAAHFAFWIQSLRLTSVASSVVLVNTNPFFVGLFSHFLGEKPSPSFWLGVALALMGMGLIGAGDFSLKPSALLGDALALLGAMCASAYLLAGRKARKTMSLLPYASLTYFVAALLLFPIAFSLGVAFPPQSDWVWLALIALVPQLLGHTTLNWALRKFPAAAVATAILGEPLLAALWAFLLFGEKLRPLSGGGIGLVLAGILWGLRSLKMG